MIIPGKIFKKYIKVKPPTISGWYLCYVKPKERDAIDHFPIAQMEVIRFNKGKWLKSVMVVGWMGALPVLSLDKLDDFSPFESGLILFFIGTEEEAETENFKMGAFYRESEVFLQEGKDGQFIYQMNSRTSKLIRISKWNGKWKRLKRVKTIKKTKSASIKRSSTIYAVSTIKQIISKNYEPLENIISAMGKMPDKGYYIFEINRRSIVPVYRWRNGWAELSKNLTRKIINRIEGAGA